MAIRVVSSMALENVVHPTLAFDVEIDINDGQQALAGVEGWLKTEEGAYVSNLHEVVEQGKPRGPFKLAARVNGHDSLLFKQIKFRVKVIAQLDSTALEVLENSRSKDRKRDLRLKLELVERMVEATAVVAQLKELDPDTSKKLGVPENVTISTGGKSDFKLVGRIYDPAFYSPRTDGWVISGFNGPTFLQVTVISEECLFTISASDWINDYAPKLKLGRFVTVEIPAEGELFGKASEYLAKADQAFLRWDTKGVFSNCREGARSLTELLKRS